jgi:hypothetical protein
MSNNSLFDELLQGMGSAINDIREKVVEEPYFGRVVTDGLASDVVSGGVEVSEASAPLDTPSLSAIAEVAAAPVSTEPVAEAQEPPSCLQPPQQSAWEAQVQEVMSSIPPGTPAPELAHDLGIDR